MSEVASLGVRDQNDQGEHTELLVAGVGYRYLRDAALGPVMADRLMEKSWPPKVAVEDYSFSAIDTLHRLQDAKPLTVVFISAIERGDAPGTIRRWEQAQRAAPEDVQRHVVEAAQAVINLEGIIALAQYFGALPTLSVVYEVEPEEVGYGEGFSPAVADAMHRLEALLEQEVYLWQLNRPQASSI